MMVKIVAKKMALKKQIAAKMVNAPKKDMMVKIVAKNHNFKQNSFGMKKLLVLIVTVLFSLAGMTQFTKATLQASGLTCSMCSKAVKVALAKVPFVQEVRVNIKTQEYSIVFKENSETDFDALKKAVEDAGFSVASLRITGNFSAVNVQKDKHVQIGGKNFHFLNGSNQVLEGEKTFAIADKGFLSAKEFKKQSSSSKKECVQTGKAENCCVKDGISAEARVYHVII
jgi:copper chaperone CopZ